jgi:hypothetical protein
MKKRVLSAIIILILLAGCTGNKGATDTTTLGTENTEAEYGAETMSVLSPNPVTLEPPLPAAYTAPKPPQQPQSVSVPAQNHQDQTQEQMQNHQDQTRDQTPAASSTTPGADWLEAYASALSSRSPDDLAERGYYTAKLLRMQDLDFDGIPELLFSSLGTVNSVIFGGFTCKNGEVRYIDFPESTIGLEPMGLTLYRSKITGERQWISHSYTRGGPGLYGQTHSFFSFDNLLQPKPECFCAFTEDITGDTIADISYALYDGRENWNVMQLSRIDDVFSGIMLNYQIIPAQAPIIHTDDLLKGDSRTEFDMEKLCEFLSTWDCSEPIPEAFVDPAILSALDRISLSFYYLDTKEAQPTLNNCQRGRLSILEDVRRQAIEFYRERELGFYDDYGFPRDLSYCKVYSLPGREDLLVVTGDQVYGWPMCYLFSYQNGVLSSISDSMFREEGIGAEEIRIFYEDSFPYALFEVASYSHQGNGGISVYGMTTDGFVFVASFVLMSRHYSPWHDLRDDPIFEGVPLDDYEMICCTYENWRHDIVYEDINADGYVDIVFRNFFQCLGETGYYDNPAVLMSQEVKKVYLYNEQTGSYEYSENLSIQSPLEHFWFGY